MNYSVITTLALSFFILSCSATEEPFEPSSAKTPLPQTEELQPLAGVLELKVASVTSRELGSAYPYTDLYLEFPIELEGFIGKRFKIETLFGAGELSVSEGVQESGRLFSLSSWYVGSGEIISVDFYDSQLVFSKEVIEEISPDLMEALEAEGKEYEPPSPEVFLTIPVPGYTGVTMEVAYDGGE